MSIELERGDVFFFYRPRVGVPEVKRLEDVQRFFFISHPGRGERPRRIVDHERIGANELATEPLRTGALE